MKGCQFLLTLVLSVAIVLGRKGFGPTEQEWGYVNVKQGGYMFWWLHYTTAKTANYSSVPVVIWLQGGPGGSSTGFGNFGEIGPLDENLNEREYAWTKKYNVMFIDNPVGTGYSFVDGKSALTTTNKEIADDFLVMMQGFYKQFPEFNSTPVYIFCESYGGKMTAEIAWVLYQAKNAGKIEMNLKGVGLGDSWISPIDSVMTWGKYLLNQGLVDDLGYQSIQKTAEETYKAIQDGEFRKATDLWGVVEDTVERVTSNVDFYNVLSEVNIYSKKLGVKKLWKPVTDIDEEKITKIMNNQVKKALNLETTWYSENIEVFDALQGDFMKPVTDIVEKLLNQTNLDVVIYNGQLDLIVDTPGTIKWVNQLNWKGAKEWNSTDHSPMIVGKIVQGFYKNVDKLTFYWVSRAGHMVPYDNPVAMDYILNKTIETQEEILSLLNEIGK